MPILKQAELVGILYLENNQATGAFSSQALTVLELLAAQAAASLENALFVHKEQAARRAAQEAERRAALLAEASALLGASIEYEEVLRRVAKLSIRDIAQWFVIDLLEDGAIQRVAGAHADPDKQAIWESLERHHPPTLDSRHPSAQVIRTGKPQMFPLMSEDQLRSICMDGEHLSLFRALGTESLMSLPLVARGATLGAMTLGWTQPGFRLGKDDFELAQELAHRVTLAIDNARLYRTAKEAIQHRDTFLVVASHELYTPMTSLRLSLQQICEPRDKASSAETHLARVSIWAERANKQGRRLTRLIGDLLDVSRIEVGRLAAEITEVDLAALVHDTVELFKPDLAQSGCQLTLSGPASMIGRWDRSQIEQVVANLLNNAIKFGARQPIEIRLDEQHGMARFIITDHGIGIDPERQPRIFGRFERAVSPQHYGGLGLGLYICRKIVEAHGGSIHVESRPDAGATFTVELPLCG
jgi:signal transduction histidine kinase